MENKLTTIKTLLADRIPYCSGICAVPPEKLVLYYGKKTDTYSHRVDFVNASEEEQDRLARVCEPAIFGLNQQDIYDVSYRKAGKMDTTDFATQFSPESIGLVKMIRERLLQGENVNKGIHIELYKLNVYGKDSFFKSHIDTPRGEAMFGSLIVVLPTEHEGGALLLRHGGQEWEFDSAKAIVESSEPCVGVIAFYSDVEHEITPVKSGYRYTLTYNLYFTDGEPNPLIRSPPSAHEIAVKGVLVDLLNDSNVLPDGGYFGFGLHHQYPMSNTTNANSLSGCLKGSDALVARVCNQLGLKYTLRVFYRDIRNYVWESQVIHVLLDRIVSAPKGEVEDIKDYMCSIRGARRLRFVGEPVVPDSMQVDPGLDPYMRGPCVTALEVVDMKSVTGIESTYLAYGNEAKLGHVYGSVCLMVAVGKPGDRFGDDLVHM